VASKAIDDTAGLIEAASNDWAKRLEEGTYAMLFGGTAEKRREITAAELGAILSGIDLSAAKRRKRYGRGIALRPLEGRQDCG
jgi:hypothetical protein